MRLSTLLVAFVLSCLAASAGASAAPFTAESFHAAAGACHSRASAPHVSAPSSARALDAMGAYSATIDAALDLTQWSQQNSTTPFFPPFSWQKLEGVYPSYIGFNTVGGPTEQIMRQLMAIYDNNVFVTMWVLQMSLEATRFGVIDLDDAAVLKGINLILTFKEHDDPDTTPTIDFWQEIRVNGSWQQDPINVAEPIHMLQAVAAKLQAWCDTTPKVCPTVEPIINFAEGMDDFATSFGIPADFDDSSVNLSLGALLFSLKSRLPQSWAAWDSSFNKSPKGLMERFTLYAYRPFSTDFVQNSIDTRSYYWLRDFIAAEQDRADAAGEEPSLLLIPTWIDNITSSDAHMAEAHKMPFLTNNVDGSVVSNSVFGILSAILMHAPSDGTGDYADFVTPDLLQLVQDSSRLLAWIVESEILLTRNDIVLLYYPAQKDFYLFAARSLQLLQSTDIDAIFIDVYGDEDTADALHAVEAALASAMRNQGTATLLSQAKSSTVANESYTFWDDFLGNADTDAQNRSTPHYDDRLFTTAIAANALFAIWTETLEDESGATLAWTDGVSLSLTDALSGACTFLDEQLVSGNYRPQNAFFSGSVKGPSTMPFYYPANLWRFANGTVVSTANITWDIIADIGVSLSGVVTEDEYQAMMDNSPLHVTTPTVFSGYNVDCDGMIFWSAPPLTYAAGMLALGKCALLQL